MPSEGSVYLLVLFMSSAQLDFLGNLIDDMKKAKFILIDLSWDIFNFNEKILETKTFQIFKFAMLYFLF